MLYEEAEYLVRHGDIDPIDRQLVRDALEAYNAAAGALQALMHEAAQRRFSVYSSVDGVGGKHLAGTNLTYLQAERLVEELKLANRDHKTSYHIT